MIRQIADQASPRGGTAGTAAGFTLGLPGRQPSFRLVRQARDRCIVLSVTGPLDLGSAGQLAARAGAQLIVAGLPGHLEQRLRDAALPRRFALAENVDDALGMLTSPP